MQGYFRIAWRVSLCWPQLHSCKVSDMPVHAPQQKHLGTFSWLQGWLYLWYHTKAFMSSLIILFQWVNRLASKVWISRQSQKHPSSSFLCWSMHLLHSRSQVFLAKVFPAHYLLSFCHSQGMGFARVFQGTIWGTKYLRGQRFEMPSHSRVHLAD